MGDPFSSLGGILGNKGGLPGWKLGPGGNMSMSSKTALFRKLRFNSRTQIDAAAARSKDALALLFAESTVADACTVMATIGLAPATISRFASVKDRGLAALGLDDPKFSQSMSSNALSGSA
eukprot:7105684-Pyramimonas_sp.AAC.1